MSSAKGSASAPTTPPANSKGSNKKGGLPFVKAAKWLILAIVSSLVFFVFGPLVCNVVVRGEPIKYQYANFLMYIGGDNGRTITKKFWADNIEPDLKAMGMMDKTREYIPVPEMDYKNADGTINYSFEKLRVLTENWKYPAVVRGIFKDTDAYNNWQSNPERIMQEIGHYSIPYVEDATYGTLQNGRTVAPFRTTYSDILGNKTSRKYLFFPVKSRFSFNHSELASLDELQKKLDKVVRKDLDLDRIWPYFGDDNVHTKYFGSQLIAGNGLTDDINGAETTGTGWHCAAGNNWFAQVVGVKKWYFMDPEYSSYMHPLRGGQVNMMTGTREMSRLQKHIPIKEIDVRAGDLLYNPDWEWHTIKNYEGLSIGVPLREVNLTLSFQNNWHFTTIVFINKFFKNTLGMDLGGYPPSA